MKIVSVRKKLSLTIKCAGTENPLVFFPGNRVLLNDLTAEKLKAAIGDDMDSSKWENFYCQHVQKPKNWTGKTVGFYVSQGLGDNLIATALSHYFTKTYGASCWQAADIVHEPIWLGNEYINDFSALPYPVPVDSLVRTGQKPFFDWFFFLEDLYHWTDCGEQLNAYDAMFSMVGVDPKFVPKKFKRPVFNLIKDDIDQKLVWCQNVTNLMKVDLSKGYICLQLRSSNVSRNLPLRANEILMERLNEVGLPVLVYDNQMPDQETCETISKYPNLRNVCCTINNIRLLGAIIAGATLVAGPDSSCIHFAAASNTPCLSIWGPFTPEQRIKYYDNQIGLHYKSACPNAPCTNFLPDMPISKCPQGINQKSCACFDVLQRKDIDNAIQDLLGAEPSVIL